MGSVFYGTCDRCDSDAVQYRRGEYLCREHSREQAEEIRGEDDG